MAKSQTANYRDRGNDDSAHTMAVGSSREDEFEERHPIKRRKEKTQRRTKRGKNRFRGSFSTPSRR